MHTPRLKNNYALCITHCALCFLLCAAGLSAGEPSLLAGAEQPRPPQPHASFKVAIPSGGGTAEIQDMTRFKYGSYPPSVIYQPPRSAEPERVVSEPIGGEPVSEPEAAAAQAPEPLVLAQLDGRAITDQDVMRELWRRRGRETLEWMIGKAVLERELSRLGQSISDKEVDKRLEEHLAGLGKAFPGVHDRDALTRAAAGMRLDEYRERSVWVELALRKIMRVSLRPTDDQLRSYYAERQADFIQPERVRISQIFIAPRALPENDNQPTPADWATAEKQILEAHARLRVSRSDDEFAEIAKAYGTGGQLSRWVGRGELLRELEDAAFSLQAGSVSAPLKSGMGYHIIRTEEKRERNLPRFDDVKEQVREQFEEKRFVLLAGEFMQRLRERAQLGGALVVGEVPEIYPPTPEAEGKKELTEMSRNPVKHNDQR